VLTTDCSQAGGEREPSDETLFTEYEQRLFTWPSRWPKSMVACRAGHRSGNKRI
jgi:hypothetical protein